MACKPIFAFHAIYHFAFLYRILDFTHNLKKNPLSPNLGVQISMVSLIWNFLLHIQIILHIITPN